MSFLTRISAGLWLSTGKLDSDSEDGHLQIETLVFQRAAYIRGATVVIRGGLMH